jgi:hypothetical protein
MEIQDMAVLTLAAGLCCVGFINPIDVAGVRRQGIALSIGPNGICFQLKTETDYNL